MGERAGRGRRGRRRKRRENSEGGAATTDKARGAPAGRRGLTRNRDGGCNGRVASAEFPDPVDAPLRARLLSLRVAPGEVTERFVRGTGAGGQKINKTS